MRPIAVRSLWHIAHAVSYEPSPSRGCKEAALTPAMTLTRLRHPPQDHPPAGSRQPFSAPQCGQQKPSGYRSQSR